MRKPTKKEVDTLIKRCAENMFARDHNAPLKIQARIYDSYMKKLAEMEKKYPHIDFDAGIETQARKWIQEHIMGPGVTW